MGKETRRKLVIIPTQVKIREHVRCTYSCRRIMGIPLYRQEQELNRQGILPKPPDHVRLAAAGGGGLAGANLSAPARAVVPPQGAPCRRNHLIGAAQAREEGAEQPIALYEYQPDRKARHPEAFLQSFQGYLHADGYEGYHKLPETMAVVGCWAHLRRKFDEAQKVPPKAARENILALVGRSYCDRLFAYEHKVTDLSPEKRNEELPLCKSTKERYGQCCFLQIG